MCSMLFVNQNEKVPSVDHFSTNHLKYAPAFERSGFCRWPKPGKIFLHSRSSSRSHLRNTRSRSERKKRNLERKASDGKVCDYSGDMSANLRRQRISRKVARSECVACDLKANQKSSSHQLRNHAAQRRKWKIICQTYGHSCPSQEGRSSRSHSAAARPAPRSPACSSHRSRTPDGRRWRQLPRTSCRARSWYRSRSCSGPSPGERFLWRPSRHAGADPEGRGGGAAGTMLAPV